MTSDLSPGTLVRLRSLYASRGGKVKHINDRHDGSLAVIIKSIGKDPNDREYFDVLVNDQVLMAWDDELERRD